MCAPKERGLRPEELHFRVRKGFLSEERGSYGMGAHLKGAVCSSGGNLVKGALRWGRLSKEPLSTPGGEK